MAFYWITAPWCAPEHATFLRVLLFAIVIDAVPMQTGVALIAVTESWVNADDADTDSSAADDSDDEHPTRTASLCCGGLQVDLHPVHGQWRYVGESSL